MWCITTPFYAVTHTWQITYISTIMKRKKKKGKKRKRETNKHITGTGNILHTQTTYIIMYLFSIQHCLLSQREHCRAACICTMYTKSNEILPAWPIPVVQSTHSPIERCVHIQSPFQRSQGDLVAVSAISVPGIPYHWSNYVEQERMCLFLCSADVG